MESTKLEGMQILFSPNNPCLPLWFEKIKTPLGDDMEGRKSKCGCEYERRKMDVSINEEEVNNMNVWCSNLLLVKWEVLKFMDLLDG